MGWGESGNGDGLTLNYGAMCNDVCQCNGNVGYCYNTKKTAYRESRCVNACQQWFPNDSLQREMCKGYCWISSDQYQNLPNSKADYLSRFQLSNQPIQYQRAPLIGAIPNSNNLSWAEWRTQMFKAHTGCMPTGGGTFQSNNAYFNILGQQTSPTYATEGDCDKWTGYSSRYINGIYLGKLQPVTLRMLYSYSSPFRDGINFFDNARKFCDNLFYENGDIIPPQDRPFACGGNGPDISNYSPVTAAMNKMQPELDAITATLEVEADEALFRVKLIWLITVIIIIIVVMYFVWRK